MWSRSAALAFDPLLYFVGPLMFSQGKKVIGEDAGQAESEVMVVAQHAAAAGQGIFGKLAGPLVLTQQVQTKGEAVGRAEGVRVGPHPTRPDTARARVSAMLGRVGTYPK